MKKYMILWAAMFGSAMAVLLGIPFIVSSSNRLVWEHKVIHGDVSKASNLRISYEDAWWNRQMRWNSTWKPGEEAVTEFQVWENPVSGSPVREDLGGNGAYLGVTMNYYFSGNDLMPDKQQENSDSEISIWYTIFQELANETAPGTWGEGEYKISDYVKDIRAERYGMMEDRSYWELNEKVWEVILEQSRKLRFAVPEDAYMEIRLFKDDKGKITALEYDCLPYHGEETYTWMYEGIRTPYGDYFMLPAPSGFKPVQGSGIYRISYGYDDENTFYCQEPVKMVDMDDQKTGLGLKASTDGESMSLLYEKDHQIWLAVYDTRDCQLQQEILIRTDVNAEKESADGAEWIHMDEDSQVIHLGAGDFVSLYRENGMWKKVSSGNLSDVILPQYSTNHLNKINWEDGNLILSDAVVHDDMTAVAYQINWENLGGVCVYKSDELIYMETFANDNWSGGFRYGYMNFDGEGSVQLEWEEQ